MPPCSTRVRASRDTWVRSISFSVSCCCRISRASTTDICCFFLRPNKPGSMSLMLSPTSSTPWGVNISRLG